MSFMSKSSPKKFIIIISSHCCVCQSGDCLFLSLLIFILNLNCVVVKKTNYGNNSPIFKEDKELKLSLIDVGGRRKPRKI